MNENTNMPSTEDKGGIGWGILSFLIPLVGLILFLVWKDSKPKTAKLAGTCALASVILGVVYYVLMFIIAMV